MGGPHFQLVPRLFQADRWIGFITYIRSRIDGSGGGGSPTRLGLLWTFLHLYIVSIPSMLGGLR